MNVHMHQAKNLKLPNNRAAKVTEGPKTIQCGE